MKSVFGRSAIPEWNARRVVAPPHYRLQMRAWLRHRHNSIGKSELFDESGDGASDASSLFRRDEMMRGNSYGEGGERAGVSENAVGVPPLTLEKHI